MHHADGTNVLKLFLCGDVMTGRGIDQILRHPSSPALYEPYVQDARHYVESAEMLDGTIPRHVAPEYVWGDALDVLAREAPDARIVNLETSVTTCEEARPKGINYRMHPENVGCLTAAKLDVCVLANNHVLDWGTNGLIDTIDALRGAGIATAGAGRTRDEAERPAIVERRGGRILVFGFGDGSSGVERADAPTLDHPGVALLRHLRQATADAIGARVARIKRPGDVVVASLHWGSNWGYEVPESHVRFARALIERGVDVVHGHSSHHPRPIEIHDGRPILYGCGDLLNDYEGIVGHESFRGDLALMYFVSLDATTGVLVDLQMVPMRIRKMRLEHASREDAAWLCDELARVSAPYGTSITLGDDGRLRATAATRVGSRTASVRST